MDAGIAYRRINSALAEYCSALGLEKKAGLPRALYELLEGIVFSGSVQLTNAARRFCSNASALNAGVKRLSMQLSNHRVDHHPWLKELWAYLGAKVQPFDVIAVDQTDLAKPYARHMEYQCKVRDGSVKAKAGSKDNPLVQGYWVFGAYHWQEKSRTLAPLILMPYSQESPDFRSENDFWQHKFYALSQATGNRGVWVMDRGFNRPSIYKTLCTLPPKWIMRLRADTPLIGPDGAKSAGALAQEALLTRPERSSMYISPFPSLLAGDGGSIHGCGRLRCFGILYLRRWKEVHCKSAHSQLDCW